MVAEVGPSGTVGSESANMIRPMVGGKAQCKEFLKKGLMKRPQRYGLGTVALCKICQYQMNTELLICKCSFLLLIHEIA